MSDEVDRDAANRLWDYKGQMETIFYQRASFFLLAESMLLVAFATVLSAKSVAVILGVFGLLFTCVWFYVNWRHTVVYCHVRDNYLRQACPEYAKVRDTCPRGPISSRKILAYYVPALTFSAWFFLLILLLVRQTA